MSSCHSAGNADMYGLGIRMAIYLQWFGSIFAAWLAPTEVPGLRLANSFFISATFLALIIQSSDDDIQLRPVDVYITLLLTYGVYYYFVPIYLWRLVTRCSPFWDPTRWSRVPETIQYKVLNLCLLMAVTCYQMWFWTTEIYDLPSNSNCPEYGFFFAMVPFKSSSFVAANILFVAANILFAITLFLCCVVSLCFLTRLCPYPRRLQKQEKKLKKKYKGKLRYLHLISLCDRHFLITVSSDERRWRLQLLQTLSNLVVASLVTAAVELTIQRNDLGNVNDVSTAGQTIPVVIAAGLIAHMLYVSFWPGHDAEIRDSIDPDGSFDTAGSSYDEDIDNRTQGSSELGGPFGEPFEPPIPIILLMAKQKGNSIA